MQHSCVHEEQKTSIHRACCTKAGYISQKHNVFRLCRGVIRGNSAEVMLLSLLLVMPYDAVVFAGVISGNITQELLPTLLHLTSHNAVCSCRRHQRQDRTGPAAHLAASHITQCCVISGKIAKDLLPSLLEGAANEKGVRQLVTEKGMTMVTDEGQIAAMVEQAVIGNVLTQAQPRSQPLGSGSFHCEELERQFSSITGLKFEGLGWLGRNKKRQGHGHSNEALDHSRPFSTSVP
eukprot:1160483-Pelagomonas_calceolata.AAC.3